MKAQLLRTLIEWLWRQYPYLMKEIVVGHDCHVHKNPRKQKPTAVVNFPQEADNA